MDTLDILLIIVAIICIYFSYKLTLIESAYMSLTGQKIKSIRESDKELKTFEKNLKNIDDILSVCLFGDFFFNMLCAVSISVLLYRIIDIWGLLLGTIISTTLIVVIGQMLPKSIGSSDSCEIALKDAGFINALKNILYPFTFITGRISNNIIKLSGKDIDLKGPLITEDKFKDMVNFSFKEGILGKNELGFIENVMGFSDSYAKDIMTPRTDIAALEINSSYEDILEIVKEEGFSRIPVYEEDIDNIVGILHIKDLFRYRGAKSLRDFKVHLRKPYYTFEYKEVSTLFTEMRSKKTGVAIVTDEYGGTEGMITMEDLIEKIVGSISDEYDEDDEEEIIKISENTYMVEGTVNLDDINHALGTELESEEYDTIAGYLIEHADRFPKAGEKFMIDEVLYIIKEISKNRIDKVIIKLLQK